MGTIFVIANQKGGVGKTTTTVNLSAGLAAAKKKTLLVDLDPQGNATSGVGIDKNQLDGTIYDVLLNTAPLESVKRSTSIPDLDIIPANQSLIGAQVELVEFEDRDYRLKQSLDPWKSQYDYIIIDTPPSLGLLTINALVSADKLIVPLQCEYYALEGLGQLVETIQLVQEVLNPQLELAGVILTMYDHRTNLTAQVADEVRKFFPDKVYNTIIPRSVRLAEAPSFGERTVKLQPQVHSETLDAAIPTIPPNAILPFLTRPLAVGENELEEAGYITTGLDDRIALGNGSQFYARRLKDEGPEYYQIVRPGKPIRHPDTGELLAYEAVYLGNAHRLETGDPSKLVVTEVKQEIIPTDRLVEAPSKVSLPYYYPRAPKTQVAGRIVSALNAVDEIGPLTVVGISLGTREGMEEGNVLRVMRHAGMQKDPVTRQRYQLPDEQSALVMVFRTYEKMSYALVMTATQPVHMLDAVVTP